MHPCWFYWGRLDAINAQRGPRGLLSVGIAILVHLAYACPQNSVWPFCPDGSTVEAHAKT
eukprot:6866800-Pyramimonas_sp.AAC.1